MSVLVCYLVAPGYEQEARDFNRSYAYYEPGENHDFAYVVKSGAQAPLYSPPWCRETWVDAHPNRGMDIWSLQMVCREHSDYDWVMWFGSNCRIQSELWLAKFYKNAMSPGVALVGASGSYESGISGTRPNLHLRTNCLMVAPSVLNSLEFPLADTREDCYHFEHGPDSLTAQLLDRGFRVLVVGADGWGYEGLQWPESDTFRRGEQENLMVADKHTDAYLAAGPGERTVLEGMAWTL